MVLYKSGALFAPEIFAFNIFISKLEEETGSRHLRWVQKIKLGRVAETGKGDLEWQDRIPWFLSPDRPLCVTLRKPSAPEGAPRFRIWPPPLSSSGFPNLGTIAIVN